MKKLLRLQLWRHTYTYLQILIIILFYFFLHFCCCNCVRSPRQRFLSCVNNAIMSLTKFYLPALPAGFTLFAPRASTLLQMHFSHTRISSCNIRCILRLCHTARQLANCSLSFNVSMQCCCCCCCCYHCHYLVGLPLIYFL